MSGSAVRAWIGLGANLGHPLEQLLQARRLLAEDPLTSELAASSLYRTAPWGYRDQPAFLNAVLLLETGRDAASLFAVMARIEESLGRPRDRRRWGPRIIDLDLLLFGDSTNNGPSEGPWPGLGEGRSDARDGRSEASAGLRVPHPRMHLRRFVLEPLHEVAPGLCIPGHGRVDDLLAGLIRAERRSGDRETCRRLREPRWDRWAAPNDSREKPARCAPQPGAETAVH